MYKIFCLFLISFIVSLPRSQNNFDIFWPFWVENNMRGISMIFYNKYIDIRILYTFTYYLQNTHTNWNLIISVDAWERKTFVILWMLDVSEIKLTKPNLHNIKTKNEYHQPSQVKIHNTPLGSISFKIISELEVLLLRKSFCTKSFP